MINDFRKALDQLRDPQIIRPLLYSAIAALVMLSAMVILSIWLIKSAGLGEWTPSWTFLSFLNNAIQLLFDIIPIVVALFLFPAVAVFLQAFFLDNVVDAVEARHYPGHKSSHHQRWHEIATASFRFASLAIALNLCLLIISIFLLFLAPPLAPIPFYLINGYLLGRSISIWSLSDTLQQAMRTCCGSVISAPTCKTEFFLHFYFLCQSLTWWHQF